jgi:signal transduction histidine kinase
MKSVGRSLFIYYAASASLIVLLLGSVTIFSLFDSKFQRDQHLFEELEVRWALCGIPILVIVIIATLLSLRRAFSPIKAILKQLPEISSPSARATIRVVETDQPLQELVNQVNAIGERHMEAREQLLQFSAKVAHELRAPITLLQLQMDYASPTLDPELATSLKGQIKRLGEYVETALLVARAERGTIPINKVPLPVNQFFSDLIKPYELRAKAHRRILTSRLNSAHEIEIDPRIVALIFNNLVSNAFYHGEGEIRVLVRDNGSSTLLSIANRIRTGTRSNFLEGGTGMGFRTVQSLASAHGDLRVSTRKWNNLYGVFFRICRNSGVKSAD